MKILPEKAEFFHAKFRDKRSDMKLTVAFHNSVHMPKTWAAEHIERGWLRNCAEKRKLVGLITYGVTGIFYRLKTPGLTMVLGSTRSLT